ncbi:conserved hypothetical protein [uncultured Defluviicoccus sp.]|uniref:Glycosyl hydrolase family 5 n=1 Tax=metagenome TaxID=256318 RepID=A0A380TKF4_9ZZZZ|nr:conserved hypothetical protein [uncultured Defluviicoccus sp.]
MTLAAQSSAVPSFRTRPSRSPWVAWGCAGLIAAALVLIPAVSPRADAHDVAVLRVLDKITARVSILNAPLHQVMQFGTLEIVARACDKRPPEETPESAAFLEIWEIRPGKPVKSVFTGWMFASTPGLSALEHPIYDLWVLDCVSKSDSAADSASGGNEP